MPRLTMFILLRGDGILVDVPAFDEVEPGNLISEHAVARREPRAEDLKTKPERSTQIRPVMNDVELM